VVLLDWQMLEQYVPELRKHRPDIAKALAVDELGIYNCLCMHFYLIMKRVTWNSVVLVYFLDDACAFSMDACCRRSRALQAPYRGDI
jgi:hypothetical protein